MPLGYGQETDVPTVQGAPCLGVEITPIGPLQHGREIWHLPHDPSSACGFVDESCGPARALRAVWTAYGQHPCCPQAAHTLGPLAHKLHRLNNKITERM